MSVARDIEKLEKKNVMDYRMFVIKKNCKRNTFIEKS